MHIDTQTIHRTTQLTNNLEECGPCPVFASFTLEFALQLRKSTEKVRVRKTSVRVQYTLLLPKHPNITKHTHTHTQTHTLQNNIKPPQYKLTL